MRAYMLSPSNAFRKREFRQDMGGVGSFNTQNKTLYVGRVSGTADMGHVVRKHFEAFGEIERCKMNLPLRAVHVYSLGLDSALHQTSRRRFCNLQRTQQCRIRPRGYDESDLRQQRDYQCQVRRKQGGEGININGAETRKLQGKKKGASIDMMECLDGRRLNRTNQAPRARRH